MLGLALNEILLLFFVVISCAENTFAGSKKKDLSRFTQSLDLVSVLQVSLRRNNDDYRDQPDNVQIPTPGPKTKNIDSNIESDTDNERNSIDDARRNIDGENTDSYQTITTENDTDGSLLDIVIKPSDKSYENTTDSHKSSKEETKANDKLSNTNKKLEDIETKSNEQHFKPLFMKSLEETKVEYNSKSHYMTSYAKNTKSDKETDQESTTLKDPWIEVIRRDFSRFSKTSLAPYLLGKETTTRLMYKVLTAKRERHHHRRQRARGPLPHFVQTELNDTGVVVAAVHVDGPLPDFKLPKERRQYRVDSDYEDAEGASAVSGDEGALVPR